MVIIINADAGGDDEGPRTMKAFINRDDIDFGNVNEMTPTQVLLLLFLAPC